MRAQPRRAYVSKLLAAFSDERRMTKDEAPLSPSLVVCPSSLVEPSAERDWKP